MGSATSQDRFAACKSLLDYGFANYALITPEVAAENLVPVKLGRSDAVRAVPGGHEALLIEKAQRGSITSQITLEESVTAPVSRGQRLGQLTIKAGEQILAQIPMVAEAPVERLSWLDLFLRNIKRICMGE